MKIQKTDAVTVKIEKQTKQCPREKRTDGQTMIYNIKLKTKQRELKKNTGVTSGVSEGFLDPCPIIAPVVLLLNDMNIM
jgi:hypothetical protein